MTTIVAIQKDDGVYFGADSLVTATRKYSHPRMTKITQRGAFIIAGSGERGLRYCSTYLDTA